MFEINKKREHRIILSDKEQTPIFIIDSFLTSVIPVIEEAKKVNFKQLSTKIDSYYPGSRAPLGNSYSQVILEAITPLLHKYYHVPTHLNSRIASATLSLLTKQTQDLNYMQCMPHYDDVMPHSFAVLHYINEGDFGGTGFYKHKPTNFENITQKRESTFISEAEKYLNNTGYPKQEYFTESDNHFELMGHVEYVPNRLVIYPTTILHSAFIKNQNKEVSTSATQGRLTANLFVKFGSKAPTNSTF